MVISKIISKKELCTVGIIILQPRSVGVIIYARLSGILFMT